MIRNNGRGLAGPPQDQVRSANGMIGSKAIQDETWPYWWAVPRANAEHVQRVRSIPAPPNATVTEVLALQVPAGFVFVLRSILQGFSSGISGAPVWTEGSGDILWTVDVDNPTGSLSFSGYGLPDLTLMAESRGSVGFGPWPVEGYNVFNPYQTIRYKVVTTAEIAPGAPNYITCGLFGWYEKAL